MKIEPVKFGTATAIVVGIIWALCGLLVFSMPGGMMRMGGHMGYADYGHSLWFLNWGGYFFGLVTWPIIAGMFTGALAAIYNRLLG